MLRRTSLVACLRNVRRVKAALMAVVSIGTVRIVAVRMLNVPRVNFVEEVIVGNHIHFSAFLISLCFSIASAGAAVADPGAAVSKTQLDQLASEYYFRGAVDSFRSLGLGQEAKGCVERPSKGPSCVDEACRMIGSHHCDEISEIEKVGMACRGNWDGGCLVSTCRRVGAHHCDDLSEIEKVAVLCRDQRDGSCVETACGMMGSHHCDEISEMEQVGAACRWVDGACIKSVCGRVGAHNCDDISELERVANSCRGN